MDYINLMVYHIDVTWASCEVTQAIQKAYCLETKLLVSPNTWALGYDPSHVQNFGLVNYIMALHNFIIMAACKPMGNHVLNFMDKAIHIATDNTTNLDILALN